MSISDVYQTADWKTEKHVPIIECPDQVNKDEFFNVTVSIGKEIAHPNTTEHHISWIEIYFHPEGEKYPYQIGKAEFSAHGSSVQGPNTSTIYTHHTASLSFKTQKPGYLYASSYCNIHGLWKNEKQLSVNM